MSFIASAVVGTVASVGGAYLSSKAAKDAAKSQSKSAQAGIDAELQMFREGQEATAPWREMGEGALGQLGSIYGISPVTQVEDPETGEMITSQADQVNPYDAFKAQQDRLREGFTESPGYGYQLEQANKAAMRSAAAGGMSGSGAEMKELQRVAQGQAAGEWGNYLNSFNEYTNSLKSIANVGQTTATQGAQMGANVAGSVAGGYKQMGAAQAQNDINQANVMTGAIQQGVNAYGMYKGYNQQPQQQQQSYQSLCTARPLWRND